MLTTDCIRMEDCPISAEFCNDNCDLYEIETHPFVIAANRDCEIYHERKDMGDFD